MYLDLDLCVIYAIHCQKNVFKPAETALNSFLEHLLGFKIWHYHVRKKSNGLARDTILSPTARSHVHVKAAITVLRCYFPVNFFTISQLEITVLMSELAWLMP